MMLIKCSNVDQPVIQISSDASALEQLAAKEIRRYVYQRTDELLVINQETADNNTAIKLEIDNQLEEQEFKLNTDGNMNHRLINI